MQESVSNKNKILDLTERSVLIKRHRTERDGRVRDWIKAVFLTDDGWTAKRIAEALFIDEQTVRQHRLDYSVFFGTCDGCHRHAIVVDA